ncbi:MAG: winged helix-turn-helix domain-containing protein [Candidatus Hodarchaeota archaeon]
MRLKLPENNRKQEINQTKRKKLTNSDYSLLSKIFRSNNRRLIVISILKGCFFPNQIQKETRISFPTLSKNLRFLEDEGIIKCKNPEEKKGKIFVLSDNVAHLEPKIIEWNDQFVEENYL